MYIPQSLLTSQIRPRNMRALFVFSVLSRAAALRLPHATQGATSLQVAAQRQVAAAALSLSLVLGGGMLQSPAFAEGGPTCNADCFRECDAVAPGNQGYCKTQCDDYCASVGPTGADDVLRSDVTAAPAVPVAAPSKDCSGFKTDKAKAYCESQNVKTTAPKSSLQMNNGIFGDSGVSYSSGVEVRPNGPRVMPASAPTHCGLHSRFQRARPLRTGPASHGLRGDATEQAGQPGRCGRICFGGRGEGGAGHPGQVMAAWRRHGV